VFGITSISRPTVMDELTLFQIGSITTMLTAISLM